MSRGLLLLPFGALLASAALEYCAIGASAADSGVARPPQSPLNLASPDNATPFDWDVRESKGDTQQVFSVEATGSDGGACGSALEDEGLHQSPRLSICADQQVTRTVRLKTKQFELGFGTIEINAGIGKSATSQALTMERIRNPTYEWSEANTAATIGFVDRLFDGRVTLSTDLSWGQESSTWLDAGNAERTLFAKDRAGAARWHRFEAKLIDTADVRWLATGELASVDEGYVANAGGRPKLALSIPGNRTRLWTQIKAWGLILSATAETLANRLQDRETERVKFEWDDINVSVTTRRLERMSPLRPSSPMSSEETTAISFETMPELLLPEWGVDAGFMAPLVPELISLDFEAGRATHPLTGASDERLLEFQALLNWSGKLGETTALYWRNEETPELLGGSAGNVEQLLDVTHTIKRGDLRIGFGASVFDLSERDLAGGGFDDTSVSANFSIAYAPKEGPKINLKLGHSRDEFALDEAGDPWGQRSMSYNVSASIDLSTYVQKELDRPDVNLKAEYRRRLNDHRTTDAPDRESDDEAFLLSFDAPL